MVVNYHIVNRRNTLTKNIPPTTHQVFNIRTSPPYVAKVPQAPEYSINRNDIYKQGVNKKTQRRAATVSYRGT